MKLILDACTIINLINGQALDKVAQMLSYTFYISDFLLEQELLSNSHKIFIEALLLQGKITLITSDTALSEFTGLKSKYNLGDGETECIALCKKHNYSIATDDRKARINAVKELSEDRVVGSLYLLREAVRNNILTCEQGVTSYLLMKAEGGFLPKVDEKYLCN